MFVGGGREGLGADEWKGSEVTVRLTGLRCASDAVDFYYLKMRLV